MVIDWEDIRLIESTGTADGTRSFKELKPHELRVCTFGFMPGSSRKNGQFRLTPMSDW